jgi:hypothetical protein
LIKQTKVDNKHGNLKPKAVIAGVIAIESRLRFPESPARFSPRDQPETAPVVAAAKNDEKELSARKRNCAARNSPSRMPD